MPTKQPESSQNESQTTNQQPGNQETGRHSYPRRSLTALQFLTDVPTCSGNGLDDSDDKPIEQQLEILKQIRYKDDTEHRRTLVYWVMETSNLWIACVILILIMTGFKFLELSDTVLTTMLATATATVLGLPLVVLRGLFGEGKENKK